MIRGVNEGEMRMNPHPKCFWGEFPLTFQKFVYVCVFRYCYCRQKITKWTLMVKWKLLWSTSEL